MKQLLNSAFVGYEEFCRSRRVIHLGLRPLWITGGGGGWGGAFGKSVVAKQVTHPFLLAQNWLTHPWSKVENCMTHPLTTKFLFSKIWFNTLLFACTVEPQLNEPLFTEVLDITNENLRSGQNYSKMYGIEPRYSEFLDIMNIIRKPKRKIRIPWYNKLQCQHAT